MTTVLGYDLLNEPIPHFPKLAPLNTSLEPLYNEVVGRDNEKSMRTIFSFSVARNGTGTSPSSQTFRFERRLHLSQIWDGVG